MKYKSYDEIFLEQVLGLPKDYYELTEEDHFNIDFNSGEDFCKSKNYPEAFEAFSDALKIKFDTRVYGYFVGCLIKMYSLDKAIEVLNQKVNEYDIDKGALDYGLGRVYDENKDSKKAIEYYKKAIENKYSDAYYDLGLIYMYSDDTNVKNFDKGEMYIDYAYTNLTNLPKECICSYMNKKCSIENQPIKAKKWLDRYMEFKIKRIKE